MKKHIQHPPEVAPDKLRVGEEYYRLLFENNPHPMWVYDLETLKFLAVNDAAIHHYGYSREEFLSMTIKAIRPAEDVPALLDTSQSYARRPQRRPDARQTDAGGIAGL